MTHIDVCQGKKFEWRNGELFVVSDSVCVDTAWIDSYTVEQIKEAAPDDGLERFPVFVIQRLVSGDLVFTSKEFVTFAGGDVLCFIEPISKERIN